VAGKDVVVYTSGVWAKSRRTPSWIGTVLSRASCAFLSTDAFHEERIQNEHFVRAAQAIAAEGVWIVVQVLGLERMVDRAQALLAAAFGEGWDAQAEIHLIPPLPYGRGANVFMRTKHTLGKDFGRCLMVAAPVIRYDGLVSACCNELVLMGGGPESLRRRVASADELGRAIDAFDRDPMLQAIGSVGPGALTRLPRFADLAEAQFGSICNVCWRMLERGPDRLVRALDVLSGDAA
jgi:hypothetical protein